MSDTSSTELKSMIRFEEKQVMRQWWLWSLLISIALLPAYGIYYQIYLGKKFGDNPLPDFGLVLFLLFTLVVLYLFWNLQLLTTITDEHITVKYVPFSHVQVDWQDVAEAEVIDYGFVGGWGVRLGTKYGTVYNVSGSIGLALKLKSGRKLCVGTQKGEEMSQVIRKIHVPQHQAKN